MTRKNSKILCDNFLVKEWDVEAKYFSLSICPRLATISPFFLAKDECFAPPTHQPRVSKNFIPFHKSLKITEKVSFNIASEASYVYILSGQKLIKNAKNVHFGEFLKT